MTSNNDQNIFEDYNGQPEKKDSGSKSIDEKIKEIEDRIHGIYQSTVSQDQGSGRTQSTSDQNLKQRLDLFTDSLKNLSAGQITSAQDQNVQTVTEVTEEETDVTNTLNEIQNRLGSLAGKISGSSGVKSADKEHAEITEKDRDLYKKMFNAFYEETQNLKKKAGDDAVVKGKLETIDHQIKAIQEGLSSLHTEAPAAEVKTPVQEPLKRTEEKPAEDKTIQETAVPSSLAPHGALTLRPKYKKEGLFNDANLTEDYELGFRFHELGFKTGFFNVKLDDEDDASRIATAEFFPNTFWAAVKQRSRWVAGIVFQNWSVHAWKGNAATKYFLFRDRKSLFSFFSAFLSNVTLLYLGYAALSKIFGWTHVNSLVGHSSVLWLLMLTNLVFMISRLSHRFIFTYNWYGFSYAFFSLFRLPVDTFVNFFAIARSLNVYKNTKSQSKVVWDSTSHY